MAVPPLHLPSVPESAGRERREWLVEEGSSCCRRQRTCRGSSPLWGLKLRVLWLELEVGPGHLWIVQLFHL